MSSQDQVYSASSTAGGFKDVSSTENGRSLGKKRKQDRADEVLPQMKVKCEGQEGASASQSLNPLLTENTPLSLTDLPAVADNLLVLDKVNMYNLGIALGLNYTKMKNLMDSPTFRDDVVAAWLRGEDQVEKKAPPTWKSLITALRSERVGQNGLANKIAKKKDVLRSMTPPSPDRECSEELALSILTIPNTCSKT